MNDYFSDREIGPRARIEQTISPTVWAGLVGLVKSLIHSGAFGHRFPKSCPDSPGAVICGVDDAALAQAIQAELPGLDWPLETTRYPEDDFMAGQQPWAPHSLQILDLLEFVHRSIGKPIHGKYHDYFSHHHLTFDVSTGQTEFRDDINRIFSRNGLAYEFISTGQIQRTLSPVLDDSLRRTFFNTGDRTLDLMLEDSRVKFTSRDPIIRREALERLWDAWERLKTMADANKKKSMPVILGRAASEQTFRDRLNTEAKELTDIGNEHLIRHSETTQKPVTDSDQVDYLFHRLFAMIQLLIQKNAPTRL